MRQFCVFGNPIAHSKSPLLHNATFRFYGIDAFYGRVLLPLAFASDKVLESKSKDCLYASFLELGLSGANITVPFKQSAFLQADEVRGIGQEIGAINTWVLENNAVIGYNTDAQGFFMCLQDWSAKISNALILGAGGSAKAVAFALRQNGITPTIYNRSSARLEEFLQNGFACVEFTQLKDCQNSFDIIINTTPAGLNDENLPLDSALLTSLFARARFAFDLIYGVRTPFLRTAQDLGLAVQDGKNMLINQAALSFELWSGGAINAQQALAVMQRY